MAWFLYPTTLLILPVITLIVNPVAEIAILVLL